MEQLMEGKKYIYEIFSEILPENIIKHIIIKTTSDEEIGKYVDKKIVEFVNRHMEKPSEKNKMTRSEIDNFDLTNITMENMDRYKNNSWYIVEDTVFVYYRSYGCGCSGDLLKTITDILKINEIKIIKNAMEQYLI